MQAVSDTNSSTSPNASYGGETVSHSSRTFVTANLAENIDEESKPPGPPRRNFSSPSPSPFPVCAGPISRRSAPNGPHASDGRPPIREEFELNRSNTWPRGLGPVNETAVLTVGEPLPRIVNLVRCKRFMRSMRKLQTRSKRQLMKEASERSNSSYHSCNTGEAGREVEIGEKQPLVAKKHDAHNTNEVLEEEDDEIRETTLSVLREIIFGKVVSLLLVFVPFAWASQNYGWDARAIFWFNFAAMIPLASILGDFTEILAAHTNQVIGGLINATFGNAVELVVAVQALEANEIRVVQASMIGSIFSNLLLVLGCCFFFGGLYHKEQAFNSTSATANMSLLVLSSIALVLPTPFAAYYEVNDVEALEISRAAAVFLMFMYFQLLVFQLRTHSYLIADDDEDDPEMKFWVALVGLIFVTIIIAVLSEYLVDSIDEFTKQSGISKTFVGLIIIPVVGNAVEHMTAVSVAMKNKIDLAMGVAVGSSTQISLFVIPLIVIVGWITEKNMNLNFPHFEIILYVLSVITVNICLSNGKGNWLLGSLLITTFAMVAVGFWFEDVKDFR